MLNIKDLTVRVSDKEILNKFNLSINDGEIHVLMGKNGIGKSTLCKVLLKSPEYEITNGSINYNNQDITQLKTNEVSNLGFYLIGQSPLAIEGVTTASMLRTVLSARGDKTNILKFGKELDATCEKLGLPKSYAHKEINVGMSGGERKKLELVQMWMLKPGFIILDEIDSGLDVDALKVVSKSLKEYYDLYHPTILMVTHHSMILKELKPDFVHIIGDGKIIKTGDYNLALEIEDRGFNNLDKASIVSGQEDNE